jgi:CBS domain-containing protein
MTELQEALIALKASDAMTREFRVVEATLSLRQFADTYLLDTNRASVYYAASNGRYRGLVNVEELHQIERSVWEAEPVQRIVQALDTIPTVTEATALVEVIQTMETQKLSRMTVLSPAGAVSGVIDRGDIVRALAEKMKLAISDSAIRQIKEEGAYPQGLNLGAIAQATAELTAK